MQKISEEQIERFLNNKCSATEAAIVAAYLEEHPDENYLWNEWQQTDGQKALPEGYSGEMTRFIMKKTKPVRMYGWWMSAAACLFCILGGWWMINTPVKKKQEAIKISMPAKWLTQKNMTAVKMNLLLPDGSKVQLFPKGAITYSDRQIFLTGGAFFDVAKDKKAFTVHASDISVTALGTSFDVLESSRKISVKLYTGKVVVKGGEHDVYLMPGEQYSYNITHAVVNRSHQSHTVENGNTNDLQFDNTPLTDVFKQLEITYHTSIRYEKATINGKYFTGTVLPTDSLKTILSVIANMKNLTVTEDQEGFHIHK